jgi:EAL domain-containing protein (putative c-di-GMP-specific phosphodiesterase class I)
MSGIDLLKALRDKGHDVPFIVVTGAPTLESAVPALEYGALRYLYKPVYPADLEVVVERAVQVGKAARARRSAAEAETTLETLGASFGRALSTMWAAYQPIVRWSNQRLYAFEALLRAEEKSLPHPGAILEAAERLGRLSEIGRAIRAQVARDSEWAPAPNLFVNLHTRDLLDEALYSPDAPLSRVADRVVLEITERAAIDDVRDFRTRIATLREMGFRIAIDDLGAGFAGLTSFAQVEPEVVKIDMSLVRDIHQNATKRRLVSSVTNLCRDMGKLVVAEGVETPAERDVLVDLGCDLFQGYLFAKPGKAFPEPSFQ